MKSFDNLPVTQLRVAPIKRSMGIIVACMVTNLSAPTTMEAADLTLNYLLAGTEFELSFESNSSVYYQLQAAETLGTWLDLDLPIFGTGETITRRFSIEGSSSSYYRVLRKSKEDVWQIAWRDEFDGSGRIDPNKWEAMVGDGTAYGLESGWGNGELQWYSDRNVDRRNGLLFITVREQQTDSEDKTWNYTSARLRTLGRREWRYGRFEVRAKLPSGKGLWPAIWMLPTDNIYGDWPRSGEIDIMEATGDPAQVFMSLHFANDKHVTRIIDLQSGSFSESFHEFALEWDADEIRWYIDGQQVYSVDEWYTIGQSGQRVRQPAPFNHRFHFLLNVAVGGIAGRPNSATVFPQTMAIDYVRVYRRAT